MQDQERSPAEVRYPQGTQARLMATALVTTPTRTALLARVATPPVTAPAFLTPGDFATLRAVCDRLLGQEPGDNAVDIAGAIDTRLASGATDGWRYAALPPDRDSMRRGLAGIQETARAMFGAGFLMLAASDADAVLGAVQRGQAVGDAWTTLDGRLFFEDLLASATEIFYASAMAQDEIGYVGYADAHGWQAVGLDGHDGPEPRPVPPSP